MTAGFWIDMIDVGEGDAFLLTLGADSGDATVLIDAGPPDGGSKVADFVNKYAGNHLAMVICTHLDMDHIGGMGEVVKRCHIDKFYMNVPDSVRQDNLTYFLQRRIYKRSYSGTDEEYLERSLQTASDLVDALQQGGLTPQPILTSASWEHGDEVRLNVLNPTPAQIDVVWEDIEKGEAREAYLILERITRTEAPDTSAENNASVVLELVYKGQPYALFTADAGIAVLKAVTRGKPYPFLKVPHHGSKTGLDEALSAGMSEGRIWHFMPHT